MLARAFALDNLLELKRQRKHDTFDDACHLPSQKHSQLNIVQTSLLIDIHLHKTIKTKHSFAIAFNSVHIIKPSSKSRQLFFTSINRNLPEQIK
jgi:hypothetical protein